MLSNILRRRLLTAYDVMVPCADIVAVDIDTPLDELIDVMSGAGHSRLPVYRDTLDEVVGIVHIKDLLHYMRERNEAATFDLVDLVRRILVVAPSVRVLDLLLEMRLSRSEEHTSELQSLMRISYAVFCLKKKTYPITYPDTNIPK